MLRLSLVRASGATLWLWCAGFSLQWLLLLQSVGSTVLQRTGLAAPWHVGLPGPGIKPVSLTLEGRFSTTAPQGSPQYKNLLEKMFQRDIELITWYTVVDLYRMYFKKDNLVQYLMQSGTQIALLYRFVLLWFSSWFSPRNHSVVINCDHLLGKEPLDEDEGGEWKSQVKTQY